MLAFAEALGAVGLDRPRRRLLGRRGRRSCAAPRTSSCSTGRSPCSGSTPSRRERRRGRRAADDHAGRRQTTTTDDDAPTTAEPSDDPTIELRFSDRRGAAAQGLRRLRRRELRSAQELMSTLRFIGPPRRSARYRRRRNGSRPDLQATRRNCRPPPSTSCSSLISTGCRVSEFPPASWRPGGRGRPAAPLCGERGADDPSLALFGFLLRCLSSAGSAPHRARRALSTRCCRSSAPPSTGLQRVDRARHRGRRRDGHDAAPAALARRAAAGAAVDLAGVRVATVDRRRNGHDRRRDRRRRPRRVHLPRARRWWTRRRSWPARSRPPLLALVG